METKDRDLAEAKYLVAQLSDVLAFALKVLSQPLYTKDGVLAWSEADAERTKKLMEQVR